MADDNGDQHPVDLSGLDGFGFAPAWAGEEAGVKSVPLRSGGFSGRDERERDERERPAREKRDRRDFQGGGRPRPQEASRHSGGPRNQGGPRPSGGPHQRFHEGRGRDFVRPLDADVRILPNQKDLGPLVRKIQSTRLAYPLKQLAYLFLDNPASCVVRVSPRGESGIVFHTCKACGFAALSADELAAHVVTVHLGDYYTSEEVDCEPPKGAFSYVARCGLSGELLGPPNLHGYDARIREMIRTRYPSMREEAYRARIEMVRDPEAIEQWRASATKKTIYRLKNAEDAPAMDRAAAEAEFRRAVAPGLMSSSKTADLPGDIALSSPIRELAAAVRDAFAKERRFPASLFFALRGAFRHRKLAFFRANDARGPEFVTSAPPAPLDRDHAVAELVETVQYVENHPDATRASFPKDRQAVLTWLAEKGHLVAYFNGTFALPDEHPRYRPPVARKPARPEETTEKKEEAKKDETADKLAE